MLICLLVLTIAFFILTLYSILQANVGLFHLENARYLSLKILDTPSAASLFVTVVGALLVRHQFAVGVLPRINYKSSISTKADPKDKGKTSETWTVEIRNTGLGSAIIERTEYLLEFADTKSGCQSHTFESIIKELAKHDLVRNQDYWLEHITTGFTLSPKDNCLVFEINMKFREKIKCLDMVLYFSGQLGDKYSKEISFIPHV